MTALTVKDLIDELGTYNENAPVYFSNDLRSAELTPVVDTSWGEDEAGEAVVLTCDATD